MQSYLDHFLGVPASIPDSDVSKATSTSGLRGTASVVASLKEMGLEVCTSSHQKAVCMYCFDFIRDTRVNYMQVHIACCSATPKSLRKPFAERVSQSKTFLKRTGRQTQMEVAKLINEPCSRDGMLKQSAFFFSKVSLV
jgi:hypothetical protein